MSSLSVARNAVVELHQQLAHLQEAPKQDHQQMLDLQRQLAVLQETLATRTMQDEQVRLTLQLQEAILDGLDGKALGSLYLQVGGRW